MTGRIFRLLTLLVLFATPAAAQGGGLLQPEPGLMIWTVIIFVVVLAVLYRAAFPQILGAVEAREARIRDLLADAEKDREEAQKALAEQQKKLEETRAQVHELVNEGKTAGEKVKQEIMGEARQQADDLLERTRKDVRQEFESAKAELKVEAVELALAAASKLIDRNLTEEDNRRIVEEYLAEIEAGTTTPTAGD